MGSILHVSGDGDGYEFDLVEGVEETSFEEQSRHYCQTVYIITPLLSNCQPRSFKSIRDRSSATNLFAIRISQRQRLTG